MCVSIIRSICVLALVSVTLSVPGYSQGASEAVPDAATTSNRSTPELRSIQLFPGPLFVTPHTSLIPDGHIRHILVAPMRNGQFEFTLDGSFDQWASVYISATEGASIRTLRAFAPKTGTPGLLQVDGLGDEPVALTLSLRGETSASENPATASELLPIPLVWIPPFELTVRSATAEQCPVAICSRQGEKTLLTFGGPSARYLAPGRRISVNRSGQTLPPTLRVGSAGISAEIDLSLGVGESVELSIDVPIDRDRYPAVANEQMVNVLSVTADALGLRPPERPVLQILDTDGIKPIDVVVVGRSRAVLLRGPDGMRLADRLPAGRYQIVDRTEGGQGATFANLHVHGHRADTAFAVLEPLRATALPMGRSRANLAISRDGSIAYLLDVAFRPVPAATNVEVLRAGPANQERTLYPGEVVTLRFSGPGMRWMDTLHIAGIPGSGSRVVPLQHLDDIIEVRLTVPRSVRSQESLALADRDGHVVTVPFTVKPAQRPRPLSFATLRLGEDHIPLNQGASIVGSRQAKGFRDAHLALDDLAIDEESGPLNGVQYLDVSVIVRAPRGEEVARHSACYAVRPPSGARPVRYDVESGCTLINGALALDPLLGGFLNRSVPRTRMEVEVRHQQHRYPHSDVDAYVFRDVFERTGRTTWDWSLKLPTAVMVLGGGPNRSVGPVDQGEGQNPLMSIASAQQDAEPSPPSAQPGDLAFQPTGLLLELTPYRRKGPLPLTAHGGLVVSTLFEQEGKSLSRLALPLGVSIPIQNFTRTVNVQLYVGGMFPLVGKFFKDAYLVGYPGFGLDLGGS
jgi:hypothetical protein